MSTFVKVLTITLSVCATMCGSPLQQDISTMNRQQLEDTCLRLKGETSSLESESIQLSEQLMQISKDFMENNQPYSDAQATQILDRMSDINDLLRNNNLIIAALKQRVEELNQLQLRQLLTQTNL